jgi:hypothetical protein
MPVRSYSGAKIAAAALITLFGGSGLLDGYCIENEVGSLHLGHVSGSR